MIRYFLIKSEQGLYFNESIKSFYSTISDNSEVFVVNELETREKTLNKIISENRGNDIACFADDIILLPGWQELLKKYLTNCRSIGFSTVHPNRKETFNYGYDIIKEGDRVSTLARKNWIENYPEKPNTISQCATTTGCFFSVSNNALDLINHVPLEGQNRLGEMLFHLQLQNAGGEVLVLNHFIKHYGISTKSKAGPLTNSEAYLDEKKIWDSARKIVDLDCYAANITLKFHDSCYELPENLAIWGAGSNSEIMYDKCRVSGSFYLTSFSEEDGKIFNERHVKLYKNCRKDKIENLLITVEHLVPELLQLAKKYLKVENYYFLSVEVKNSVKTFKVCKL